MRKQSITGIFLALALASTGVAGPREQARLIHERLTGMPPGDAMLDAMTAEIHDGGGGVAAALVAIDGSPAVAASGDFYTLLLKNWATPWTNEAGDGFTPLNDYSATVVGMVRDEVDFRGLLSGDVMYTGVLPGIPPRSNTGNEHYEYLEAAGGNLGDPSILVQRTQSAVTGLPADAVAGVLTSRASARAFFVDGTNRAMFRSTLRNHLCLDMEQLRESTPPTDRIRQDVSRSPGGDSALFLSDCAGCHGGMDPMTQAFAYYDFEYPDRSSFPDLALDARKDLGEIVYTEGMVQPKYHNSASGSASGYFTPDDRWTNYWREGENSVRFGWRSPAEIDGIRNSAANPGYSEGNGAASLGRELANTEAFSQCQVRKVFRTVCLREPQDTVEERAAMEGLIDTFNVAGNIKQVFAEAADYCAGHL